MTQLFNAVVLITGATGGFGQELTRQLLALGSQLILTDINGEQLGSTVNSIAHQHVQPPDDWPNPRQGNIVAWIEADLSSRQGCEHLYSQVQTICQSLETQVDVVINNAGMGLYGRMDEVPQEQWEQLMQVNLLSPMRLSTLFAAEMVERRQGHIVNISSIAGWVVPPGLAHYSASKFGLRGFSEGLFNELSAHNVNVTVVYPYFSRTPILDSARYGSLAETLKWSPESNATDPARIMAATIRAIQKDQLHVFPDAIANGIQLFRRMFPNLSNWMTRRVG